MESLPTHPTQVLAALTTFVIFLVLYKLKDIDKPDGTVFITGTILYAILRFFVDFLRGDLVRPVWGLSSTQLIGIVILLIAMTVVGVRSARGSGGRLSRGTAGMEGPVPPGPES